MPAILEISGQKTTKAITSFGEKVKINHVYELTDGRVGLVRFIGETLFKRDIEWIGLEFYKGMGKNNGTVQGVSYFECPMAKGGFVQIDKVSKVVTLTDMRRALGSKEMRRRLKRRLQKKLSVSLTGQHKLSKTSSGKKKLMCKKKSFSSTRPSNNGENKKCTETIYKSRGEKTNKNNYSANRSNEKIARRPTQSKKRKKTRKTTKNTFICDRSSNRRINRKRKPREICGISNDPAASFKNKKSTKSFLDEKLNTTSFKKPEVKVPRKLGPRDIGRHTNWEPAKFNYEKAEDGDFLRERLSYTKSAEGKVNRKLGAIETGRNNSYDVAKFDLNCDDGDFLAERLACVSNKRRTRVPRKVGAIETGWADTYDVAVYEDKIYKDSNFLQERLSYRINPVGKVKRKEGAIETGRNNNYDADVAKFDLNCDDGDFLAERLTCVPKKRGGRVPRKVGAIETGWVDTYDVAVYEDKICKDSDFLQERLSYRLNPVGKVKRKEGAIETGRNNNYDAASFEYEDATGSDFLKERIPTHYTTIRDTVDSKPCRQRKKTSIDLVFKKRQSLKLHETAIGVYEEKSVGSSQTKNFDYSENGVQDVIVSLCEPRGSWV